jgi:hypothetical protein
MRVPDVFESLYRYGNPAWTRQQLQHVAEKGAVAMPNARTAIMVMMIADDRGALVCVVVFIWRGSID